MARPALPVAVDRHAKEGAVAREGDVLGGRLLALGLIGPLVVEPRRPQQAQGPRVDQDQARGQRRDLLDAGTLGGLLTGVLRQGEVHRRIGVRRLPVAVAEDEDVFLGRLAAVGGGDDGRGLVLDEEVEARAPEGPLGLVIGPQVAVEHEQVVRPVAQRVLAGPVPRHRDRRVVVGGVQHRPHALVGLHAADRLHQPVGPLRVLAGPVREARDQDRVLRHPQISSQMTTPPALPLPPITATSAWPGFDSNHPYGWCGSCRAWLLFRVNVPESGVPSPDWNITVSPPPSVVIDSAITRTRLPAAAGTIVPVPTAVFTTP